MDGSEIVGAFFLGYFIRVIIVEVFKHVTKIKKTPKLPPILVTAAIVYYYVFEASYQDLEFINHVLVAGMFFPELYYSIIQTGTFFIKSKNKSKKSFVNNKSKKIHKINAANVQWSRK
jgi:hypothetical protein